MLGKRARPVREGGRRVGSSSCWRHARQPTSLVGRFTQAGREWEPSGEPEAVSTYDFPDLAEGKAVPYGVYDVADDSAWGRGRCRSRHVRLRGRDHRAVGG